MAIGWDARYYAVGVSTVVQFRVLPLSCAVLYPVPGNDCSLGQSVYPSLTIVKSFNPDYSLEIVMSR